MSLNAQRFKQALPLSTLREFVRKEGVQEAILEYEKGELFESEDAVFEGSDAVEGGFQDYVKDSSPICWGEGTETLLEKARRWAKEQEELARQKEIHRKWMNREYYWQELLSFLKAKYGVPIADLTPEEWESKKIRTHPKKFLRRIKTDAS